MISRRSKRSVRERFSSRTASLVRFGAAKQVCDEYEQYLFGGKTQVRSGDFRRGPNAQFDPTLAATSCEIIYGNGKADIESCGIENGQATNQCCRERTSPSSWRYDVKFNEAVDDPSLCDAGQDARRHNRLRRRLESA